MFSVINRFYHSLLIYQWCKLLLKYHWPWHFALIVEWYSQERSKLSKLPEFLFDNSADSLTSCLFSWVRLRCSPYPEVLCLWAFSEACFELSECFPHLCCLDLFHWGLWQAAGDHTLSLRWIGHPLVSKLQYCLDGFLDAVKSLLFRDIILPPMP